MMTDNTENGRASAGDNAISPAEIILTRTLASDSVKPAYSSAPSPMQWVWLALFALVVIAAAVIFVLPQYVTPPVITAETHTPASTDGNASAAPAASTAPKEAAPWQTAQLARQRSKSQELLAQMLELQDQLEQKNVQAWAADEFARIIQLATDGDAAYQAQDFNTSSTLYSNAAQAMTALLNNMDSLFAETINAGNTAIDNGDATAARQAFERALVMKADDATAQAGMQRAQVLDQVLKLVTEGNDLQLNGDLKQAKSVYEQALALDKQSATAKQQLAAVNARLGEAEFTRLMSAGYAHLENNDLARAKNAFEQARRMKPGAAEASSAIAQIDARLLNDEISTLLSTATTLETQEKWSEAVAAYDQALALDANLAQAQEGKQYANSRVQLDARLEQIIAKPERLSDTAVHAEASSLFEQARQISPAEPRLAGQLDKVEKLLAIATVPLDILFRSDTLTEVTLNRVGALGKFNEKSMSLLPGKYTAVGTRPGYRDVRVEFTVSADVPGQVVVITAVEKIAAR
jgi:hypothetical protein